ncbi:MAG: hypothetical protein OXG81_07100 [Acidobacteria bacterium]|nr:hypothetical protein [Acidobacteriota bacterium]
MASAVARSEAPGSRPLRPRLGWTSVPRGQSTDLQRLERRHLIRMRCRPSAGACLWPPPAAADQKVRAPRARAEVLADALLQLG